MKLLMLIFILVPICAFANMDWIVDRAATNKEEQIDQSVCLIFLRHADARSDQKSKEQEIIEFQQNAGVSNDEINESLKRIIRACGNETYKENLNSFSLTVQSLAALAVFGDKSSIPLLKIFIEKGSKANGTYESNLYWNYRCPAILSYLVISNYDKSEVMQFLADKNFDYMDYRAFYERIVNTELKNAMQYGDIARQIYLLELLRMGFELQRDEHWFKIFMNEGLDWNLQKIQQELSRLEKIRSKSPDKNSSISAIENFTSKWKWLALTAGALFAIGATIFALRSRRKE